MHQASHPTARVITCIFFALILLTLLSGCGAWARKPKPTPLPTRAVGLLPTLTALSSTATTAPPQMINATMPASTAETGASTVETAAAEGTPEACPPPDGWIRHTVRQDETLYYLATSTGISVEEVMKANCLSTDLLQVGQRLYLPSSPAARPTFPPPPPAPPASTPVPGPAQPTAAPPQAALVQPTFPPSYSELSNCGSPFSCKGADLPPLTIFEIVPGEAPTVTPTGTLQPTATPVPSTATPSSSWISPSRASIPMGEQISFYTHQFSQPLQSIQITRPDQTVETFQPLSNDPTQPFLIWRALPPQGTGIFRLQVQGMGGEQAVVTFTVTSPQLDTILVDPVSGPPGTTFDVYYIFNKDTTRKIGLYAYVPSNQRFTNLDYWEISVFQPLSNGMEWAMKPLLSQENDPENQYLVTYHQGVIYQFRDKGERKNVEGSFWIRK